MLHVLSGLSGSLAAVGLLALPLAAQGQGHGEIAVTAGPSSYDLSGTGTALAGRASLSLAPGNGILVLEPSVGYFRYETQGDLHRNWILPELSLQLRARGGMLRPYAGVGAGIGFESGDGPSRQELTVHGVVGLRIPVSRATTVRGELRVRAVDPFVGTMADFGFGLGWRAF